MAYEKSARRFRPVGSRKKKAAPQYSPAGTGCPVVEQAVERLYREQNETHFWNLMNALNYALELKTRVLVPSVSISVKPSFWMCSNSAWSSEVE